jgi:hypothetical protein
MVDNTSSHTYWQRRAGEFLRWMYISFTSLAVSAVLTFFTDGWLRKALLVTEIVACIVTALCSFMAVRASQKAVKAAEREWNNL